MECPASWWGKFFVFVACLELIALTESTSVFNNQEVVKKARCFANCLTMLSNAGSPDPGCHGYKCSQCVRACDMISKTLGVCNESCANSTWCKTSCQYIQTTLKNWKNIYNGDGTSIPKPAVPIATAKNVTSLTLSWQPGIVNVSGSVVYLLKKKYKQENDVRTDELTVVFTEPKAVITVQDVCKNIFSQKDFYKEIKFYFTVIALTENSTLVTGDISKAIEMAKPDHVAKINIPWYIYDPSARPNPEVILKTNFTPSRTPDAKLITKYGVVLTTQAFCQDPAITPKSTTLVKGQTDIELRLFSKLIGQCNHTLKVYSVLHCIASKPKTIVYKYPGCYNIPTFDQNKCFSFDPPRSSKSSKKVRNLTHSQIQTDADFRFRVNIKWLRPLYPYYTVNSYYVEYGDANKKIMGFGDFWLPEHTKNNYRGTTFEMKNLLPSVKYKYRVTAIIPIVKGVEVLGSVDMPGMPTDDLKVQNVVPRSLGFTDKHFYSFNVTWSKPKFRYGNLVGYTVFSKTGNVTTKNNFHVVRGLRHSEPFTIQIRPNYAQKWIIGTVIKVQLKGNDPNKTSLAVQTLREEHQEDRINDWFDFVMSWKPPSFQHKTIDYYQVSYTLSGYPYHALGCKPGKIKNHLCGPSSTKDTTYKIAQVLPSEHVIFTVKPIFNNSLYVKGSENTINIDAPCMYTLAHLERIPYGWETEHPKRNLVGVRNLTYIGILERNDTKTMRFTWEKPLFRYSNVSRYVVKYNLGPVGDNKASPTVTRTRRSTKNQTNTGTITESVLTTMFSAPTLEHGKQITLEVTPVFDVEIIVGEKSSITISNPSVPVKQSQSLTPIELAGIALGVFVFVLLLAVFLFWFIRRQQQIKDGVLVGKKGAVIDQWEVPVEKIYLEEELGEGAFGKVFKGILLELPEQSAKYSIAKSIRRKSLKPLNQEDGFVVAVKMLHDMADVEQRREFLKEIQLMKDVGSHRNIVNMLGCGTLSDPMFLIVEYLPNGDLLHYLRKRRGKATKYPDSDPRGPYHSTYCQTYFNKNNPEEGLLVQTSRSDRIYVHSPENTKESNQGDIQLLSIQNNVETGNNDLVATGYDTGDCEDYDDIDDDILTPGDLMAFAWQVSQGMEYLSKRGYVHRDLAARNVLVGNNKEAKIADFGLTRHMYENLYQAKTNRKLPLKWMSVEAIFDQSFTSQSDVWAYGVFLWELVTLGGTPYPSINNRELLKLLKEGYRMDKPETCDNELYEIMCSCWRALPEDRPTFEDLRSKLEEMMTRDNPYFDPSAVDESRDYYNVPSFNSAPDPDDDDNIIEDIFGEGASSKEDEIQIVDKNKESTKSAGDNCLFSDVSPSGDPWVLELDNEASVNNDHVIGLDVDLIDNDDEQSTSTTVQPKTKVKNIKYASLDFNDIEFQIYRRQNRGFAL